MTELGRPDEHNVRHKIIGLMEISITNNWMLLEKKNGALFVLCGVMYVCMAMSQNVKII